jgi:hypothetical protein
MNFLCILQVLALFSYYKFIFHYYLTNLQVSGLRNNFWETQGLRRKTSQTERTGAGDDGFIHKKGEVSFAKMPGRRVIDQSWPMD